MVISGKDRGKRGKVIRVFPEPGKVLVEGINLAKKHLRRKQQDQQTGIAQVETPIQISNLMLFCKGCNKGARVGYALQNDGTKNRICKRCKGII